MSKRKSKQEPRKRGRPEGTGFKPTDEQRELVESLAGYGITEVEIAKLVTNSATDAAISPVTLRKCFREELDRGHTVANAKVAGALFKNATTGTPSFPGGNPTSQIFWLKTRGKGQWKDKQIIEVETPPSELEEKEIDDRIERLLQKAAGRKPNGGGAH